MSVPCECCVLSSRGLCVGLITFLEELYRMWRVQWEWSRSPVRGGYDPEWGPRATNTKKKKNSQNHSVWDKVSIMGIPAGIGQHDTRPYLRSIHINQQKKFRSFNRYFQDIFREVYIYEATVKLFSRHLTLCWSCFSQIPNAIHQSAVSDGPQTRISSRWHSELCVCVYVHILPALSDNAWEGSVLFGTILLNKDAGQTQTQNPT